MAETTISPATRTDPSLVWMQTWSDWLRRQGSLRNLPAPGSPARRALTDAAAVLARHRLFAPCFEPDLVTAGLREAVAKEADAALAAHGYHHNGKWNAQVGPVGESLLGAVDLPAFIQQRTGVRVHPPRVATYIGYLSEGDHVDLHVDLPTFGDLTMLICLSHEVRATAASQTVFVVPDGFAGYPPQPGAAMLFDGPFTPHGRSPVAAGERVVVLSLGFRGADFDRLSKVDQLPLPPDG